MRSRTSRTRSRRALKFAEHRPSLGLGREREWQPLALANARGTNVERLGHCAADQTVAGALGEPALRGLQPIAAGVPLRGPDEKVGGLQDDLVAGRRHGEPRQSYSTRFGRRDCAAGMVTRSFERSIATTSSGLFERDNGSAPIVFYHDLQEEFAAEMRRAYEMFGSSTNFRTLTASLSFSGQHSKG